MGMVLGKVSSEVPKHTVLRSTPVYEVRSYPSAVGAVFTQQSPPPEKPSSAGFYALANYYGITSAPAQVTPDPTPIAMTAPVFQSYAPATSTMETMTFLLPASKYPTVDSAPQPSDPRVKLVALEPCVAAVITFSGNFTADLMRQKEAELRAALEKDGVKVVEGAQARFAGYNPPFTLPALKTNEVMIDVNIPAADM